MLRFYFLPLVFIFTASFISPLSAQSFTGEFVKKTSYIPKNNSIDIDSLAKTALGDYSRYTIKPGYYKSQYYKDGKPGYSYTYHANTQLMYDDEPDKSYITYRDSKKGGDYTYEEPVIHKDSTIIVLGYSCYLVTQETSFGLTKTYYSDALRVNYESFKDHKVGNWYNKLKLTDGAIPLKTIVEYEDYYSITETLEVNDIKLSNDAFKLPENKKIVASFSALDERVTLVEPTVEVINCYQNMVGESQELAKASNLKTIYTRFVVTETGEITDVDVYEKDNAGLYKKAIAFIQNCGISFIPGKINGKAVASEAYFPIEF